MSLTFTNLKSVFIISFGLHLLLFAFICMQKLTFEPSVEIGDHAPVVNSYIRVSENRVESSSWRDPEPVEGIAPSSQTEKITEEKPLQKQAISIPPKPIEQVKKSYKQSHAKKFIQSQHSKGSSVDELLALLHKEIQAKQRYPLVAQELQQEGKVTVQFKLLKSGEVDAINIIKSSGSDSLDQAALAAVNQAAPFKNAAKMISQARLFKIDVVFELS